jgi:CRISPR system Cascade subunit CasD
MSDKAFLALMLNGPLQSWGFASRFERRTTGLHPTKSGVAGMICAAMGLVKGSPRERSVLDKLAASPMTSVSIPRRGTRGEMLPLLRLNDYHTVLGTRLASGKSNLNAVLTRREYLLDARFGVVIEGQRPLLEQADSALRDPVWGLWLGRKSCIPGEPVSRGVFASEPEALLVLIGERNIGDYTTVREVRGFEEGSDSLNDQPISFGDAASSGVEGRTFGVRRILLTPGATNE